MQLTCHSAENLLLADSNEEYALENKARAALLLRFADALCFHALV